MQAHTDHPGRKVSARKQQELNILFLVCWDCGTEGRQVTNCGYNGKQICFFCYDGNNNSLIGPTWRRQSFRLRQETRIVKQQHHAGGKEKKGQLG